MADEWCGNWKVFFDSVADYMRAGERPEEFARRFAGVLVTWEGILYRKELDDIAPTVSIEMPVDRMDVGHGRVAEFAGLTLPVADNAVAAWEDIAIGTAVTFTARLGSRDSVFPVIDFDSLPTGRLIFNVRLTDGVPG